MALNWLKRLLGVKMSPTKHNTVIDLDDQKRQAYEANIQGELSLIELRRIRSESQEVNQRVTKTLRENHFADLMVRALEGRP